MPSTEDLERHIAALCEDLQDAEERAERAEKAWERLSEKVVYLEAEVARLKANT